MFVKFIDENTVEKAPRVLRDERYTYSNPKADILLRFGYKPLIETEYPENGNYEMKYAETENKVIVMWSEIADEAEE